jgi:hypothetical protein
MLQANARRLVNDWGGTSILASKSLGEGRCMSRAILGVARAKSRLSRAQPASQLHFTGQQAVINTFSRFYLGFFFCLKLLSTYLFSHPVY